MSLTPSRLGNGMRMRSALENAFTHAPIGMALVDIAGRLLRVNDAMCALSLVALLLGHALSIGNVG